MFVNNGHNMVHMGLTIGGSQKKKIINFLSLRGFEPHSPPPMTMGDGDSTPPQLLGAGEKGSRECMR